MSLFQTITGRLCKTSSALLLFVILLAAPVRAQHIPSQYPLMLRHAYFEINIGYINYPFTNEHLLAGYVAESIRIPHTAVRIIPFGYHINKYLSAQISYMRPVLWVQYSNVNGEERNRSVFMNIAGLTLKGQLPLGQKFIIYGEAGLGLITRKGIVYGDPPQQVRIMENTVYASILAGAGIKYRPNDKWDFMLSAVFTPDNGKHIQPHTVFYSAGFAFNMLPLPEEKVARNENSPFAFPRNMLQIGYSTNAMGYGVNNFFSNEKFPVFWGGDAEIKKGFTLMYQRNAFHTYRTFSLDWGVSFSHWTSNVNEQRFGTLAIFPVLRFNLIRTNMADLYFNYSVAGPCYISGLNIDDEATGPHFTFQDFMGIGGYFGRDKRYVVDIRIAHFSNGNLSPENVGVKIPLTFSLGYTFEDRNGK